MPSPRRDQPVRVPSIEWASEIDPHAVVRESVVVPCRACIVKKVFCGQVNAARRGTTDNHACELLRRSGIA